MFPNRGQLTTNTDRWGLSPPSGAYSIRYRQVQENFMRELEERKKEEKRKMSERFRLNAEETLRRQRESKDRKKAYEAAEERHRKDVLTQRKQQHRQTLSQAKIYSGKKHTKSLKPNVSSGIDTQPQVETSQTRAKRTSSFQGQSSVQIPTLLKGYESDSALSEVRSKSPHGQGRILLAVDQTTPSSEQNDRGESVENRTMNSALEQLIEELKQPNLDIERFTRQMSTTPFSAKSNKSQYLHSTDKAIRLFSDSKLTKTVKTLNLTEIEDQNTPTPTPREQCISPSRVESNQQTADKHIIPLLHKQNGANILADSLEPPPKSPVGTTELPATDIIRIVSVESESSSSYSPPLSPTIGNDEPIELEDSLDEPRVPTPPLPDLVPLVREFKTIQPPLDFRDTEMVKTKVINVKSEPWNWVGIVEDAKVEETTPVPSEDECVDSKNGENEVLSTKLIGILKTSKPPSDTVRSQRRVRFGGVEYMTLQAPARQYHTSSLYPNRTFPYRVSSPTKGINTASLSIIGENRSLNMNSNPITIAKPNTHAPSEDSFSLDTTPTDSDIHLIWNQIRENLRRNTNVLSKKSSHPETVTHTHKPIISAKIISKKHPKINRVSIAPKQIDSELVAWSDQAGVQKEPQPSQLSMEENKVLASLARLDTQLEAKQAFVRSMRPQIKPIITANFSAFSGYKNR